MPAASSKASLSSGASEAAGARRRDKRPSALPPPSGERVPLPQVELPRADGEGALQQGLQEGL